MLGYLLFHSPLVFAGGAEAGNGGGIAEKNVFYADSQLTSYLDLCLGSALCKLSGRESSDLQKIRNLISSNGHQPGQLVFRSEKESPGFFIIDDQIRIAKTDNVPGGTIFINSDLLYAQTASHGYEPLDIPAAASILVHEYGHQAGYSDHAWLDWLGSKIQAFLLTQSERAELWNGKMVIYTFQLNVVHNDEDKKLIHTQDRVILSYQGKVISLDDRIRNVLHCPNPAQTPLGIRIYNLHEERGLTHNPKTKIDRKPLKAWYILSCQKGQETDHGNLEFSIYFKLNSNKSDPELLTDLIQVNEVSCSQDMTVCR